MRWSSSAAARRTMISEPRVMASAPGGTGPPTQTRVIALRRSGLRRRSEEAGCQRPAVLRHTGVVGAERLEDVDELLASLVVALHPIEEAVETRLHAGAGRLAGATQAGERGNAAHFGGFRQAGQEGERLLVLGPLDEQLGKTYDRSLVRRLELERLAQRRLVTLGHQLVSLAGRRRQASDELAHRRLGQRPDEAVDDLAVLDGIHGRDRLDLEGLGDLRVAVDVDLGELDGAVRLGHHLLDRRAQCAARPAPLGPQIDDHRNGVGTLENGGLEGGVGYIHASSFAPWERLRELTSPRSAHGSKRTFPDRPLPSPLS